MAEYLDPWAMSTGLMKARPVSMTGPISGGIGKPLSTVTGSPVSTTGPVSGAPGASSPVNRLNPYGVESMTWQEMPTFTKDDFRFTVTSPFGIGKHFSYDGENPIVFKNKQDIENLWRTSFGPNIFREQVELGKPNPFPKTFDEYLQTDPFSENSEGGFIQGPKSVDEWLKMSGVKGEFDPYGPTLNEKNYNLLSQYGTSFQPQFDENANFLGWMEKTGDKEGTTYGYQFDPELNRYIPSGQVAKGWWDTNSGQQNLDLLKIAAVIAGGAGISNALAGAGSGVAGATAGGAEAAAAGGAGAASAGTPIYMAGPGAIQMSSLPAFTAGAGGIMGPAAATAGGGGLLSSIGSKMGEMGTSDWLKLGTTLAGGLAGASGAGPQTTTTSQSLPPELQQLLANLVPRVQQTSPVLNAANQQALDTIQGKYLGSNPYLEDMVRQQQDQMQNRFGTTMMGSGAFGNANVAQQGFKAMNEAANNLRFQNYEQERQRQMQAASQAPNLNLAPFAPAFSLLGLGGRNTTQTAPGLSTGAGLLGGALGGAELYNMWFGKK